jgi:hypothetical protein
LGFFHFLLLAVASNKAYQLLAHGRWFSPASSTTKAGRHDIVEILLKVALSTKNQINQSFFLFRREPPTMGKQLVSFITCDCE